MKDRGVDTVCISRLESSMRPALQCLCTRRDCWLCTFDAGVCCCTSCRVATHHDLVSLPPSSIWFSVGNIQIGDTFKATATSNKNFEHLQCMVSVRS